MTTAVQDPVKEALKFAESPRMGDLKAKAEEIRRKIAAHESTRSQLTLEVEAEARMECERMIRELTSEAVALSCSYRKIDLSIPLSWRDKNGFPRLAIFSLNSPVMSFNAQFTGRGWEHDGAPSVEPKLPNFLFAGFNDVRERMYGEARKGYRETSTHRNGVSLTAAVKFNGVVPPETKRKIEAAKKDFGHQIFLVCEAPEWQIKEERRMEAKQLDPLVIGIRDGHAYLIDAFDLTTLEAMIKSEFTS